MVERHSIELVRHARSPALQGVVAGMVGLSERSPEVVRRRQPACAVVPLVLSFGDPLTVDELAGGQGAGRQYRSFVAGLSTGYADTRFTGGLDCIQVYLTPVGVRQVLGVPGTEVARAVVDAEQVASDWGSHLSERLHALRTWDDRFQLVESMLLERLARGPAGPAWLAWMWSRIHSSNGQARIGDLVRDTGWSHHYVARTFREEVGLSPKQLAGLVRFERAISDLGTAPQAEVALRHGYADQSHFARDVRRYAGETPSQLAAAQRPTPATAMGGSPPAGPQPQRGIPSLRTGEAATPCPSFGAGTLGGTS